MNLANMDIRNEIEQAGVLKWQIAERLGMTDSRFSVKLRREFSPEVKAKIRIIISELVREG